MALSGTFRVDASPALGVCWNGPLLGRLQMDRDSFRKGGQLDWPRGRRVLPGYDRSLR